MMPLFSAARRLVLLIALLIPSVFGADPPTRESNGLLPTEILAKEVRALADLRDEFPERQRRGNAVRRDIGNFILRQLEAMPAISERQLRGQLQSILCAKEDEECVNGKRPPDVFAESFGPNTERRQVVVTYALYLGFMGPGGTLTTIESYVWEKQKARMTSRGGQEFDGRNVNFDLLTRYPEEKEYWIFASGPPSGWSGRAFSGQAILYRVGIDRVVPMWQSRNLPNLVVHRNELGWEMTYEDRNRFYNNLPEPHVFDVYMLDYNARNYHRVIHYRY